MINVLGWPLDEARLALERAHLCIKCEEVRSRKGSLGEEPRVVRQAVAQGGTVILTYAQFLTEPKA